MVDENQNLEESKKQKDEEIVPSTTPKDGATTSSENNPDAEINTEDLPQDIDAPASTTQATTSDSVFTNEEESSTIVNDSVFSKTATTDSSSSTILSSEINIAEETEELLATEEITTIDHVDAAETNIIIEQANTDSNLIIEAEIATEDVVEAPINTGPSLVSLETFTQNEDGSFLFNSNSSVVFIKEGTRGQDIPDAKLAQYTFTDTDNDEVTFTFADTTNPAIIELIEISQSNLSFNTFDILLKDNSSFDYETTDFAIENGSLTIDFQVSDGAITTPVQLIINILDVTPQSVLTDDDTTITSSVSLAENETQGALIKTLDFDEPGKGEESIQFSLTTNPSFLTDKLVIVREEDTGKGEIKVGRLDEDGNFLDTDIDGQPIVIDYESLVGTDLDEGQASITVTATQLSSEDISEHTFQLQVSDIPPVINTSSAFFNGKGLLLEDINTQATTIIVSTDEHITEGETVSAAIFSVDTSHISNTGDNILELSLDHLPDSISKLFTLSSNDDFLTLSFADIKNADFESFAHLVSVVNNPASEASEEKSAFNNGDIAFNTETGEVELLVYLHTVSGKASTPILVKFFLEDSPPIVNEHYTTAGTTHDTFSNVAVTKTDDKLVLTIEQNLVDGETSSQALIEIAKAGIDDHGNGTSIIGTGAHELFLTWLNIPEDLKSQLSITEQNESFVINFTGIFNFEDWTSLISDGHINLTLLIATTYGKEDSSVEVKIPVTDLAPNIDNLIVNKNNSPLTITNDIIDTDTVITESENHAQEPLFTIDTTSLSDPGGNTNTTYELYIDHLPSDIKQLFTLGSDALSLSTNSNAIFDYETLSKISDDNYSFVLDAQENQTAVIKVKLFIKTVNGEAQTPIYVSFKVIDVPVSLTQLELIDNTDLSVIAGEIPTITLNPSNPLV